MQRRLSESLKDLEMKIQKYVDLWEMDNKASVRKRVMICREIKFDLVNLLTAPDKSFEVTFKGDLYNFIYPTTKEEKDAFNQQAYDLADAIVKHCVLDMHAGKNSWWMVTAFASGIDTLDMQVEIIKEDVVNRVDENGERITSLPLDKDNWHIKQQLKKEDHDKQNQAMDL